MNRVCMMDLQFFVIRCVLFVHIMLVSPIRSQQFVNSLIVQLISTGEQWNEYCDISRVQIPMVFTFRSQPQLHLALSTTQIRLDVLMIVDLQVVLLYFMVLILCAGVPENNLPYHGQAHKLNIKALQRQQPSWSGFKLYLENLEYISEGHLFFGVTISALLTDG